LICSQYESQGKALFYTYFRPGRLMKIGDTLKGTNVKKTEVGERVSLYAN
jgi:hypothetical protein